ncbi:MAG TPA: cytochrome P450 [Candidatus Elarobacter sp.]|nr:cytochrome P450 [Candidatus Elarobacter sp.]
MTPASYAFRRSAAGLMLTSYRDVSAALQDPRFAHWWLADGSSAGNRHAMERWFERMENAGSPLRAALAQRLSARGFERHRERFVRTIGELLAHARDGEPFDLVSQYAVPLVRGCVGEVIGIPAERRALFEEIVGPLCADLFSDGPAAASLLERWTAMIGAIVGADPDGDHLVGDLVRAHRGGDELDACDFAVSTAQFAAAAYENISNFIASAVAVLAERPAAWDALADDPPGVFATVEELLRIAGPMNYVPLVAREDIGGECPVKRGTTVLACLPLANRDGEQFSEPGRFERARRPNRHVSFGTGKFACIGAPFARAQAALALSLLSERFEVPLLLRDAVEPKRSRLFHGPQRLPALLTRRTPTRPEKDSPR